VAARQGFYRTLKLGTSATTPHAYKAGTCLLTAHLTPSAHHLPTAPPMPLVAGQAAGAPSPFSPLPCRTLLAAFSSPPPAHRACRLTSCPACTHAPAALHTALPACLPASVSLCVNFLLAYNTYKTTTLLTRNAQQHIMSSTALAANISPRLLHHSRASRRHRTISPPLACRLYRSRLHATHPHAWYTSRRACAQATPVLLLCHRSPSSLFIAVPTTQPYTRRR